MYSRGWGARREPGWLPVVVQKFAKRKHLRAFQAIFGWRGAPVLAITVLGSALIAARYFFAVIVASSIKSG